MGISVGIIICLFMIQRFGTEIVGHSFSPVLSLWFISNALIGIYNIAKYQPDIFRALSPHYWWVGGVCCRPAPLTPPLLA